MRKIFAGIFTFKLKYFHFEKLIEKVIIQTKFFSHAYDRTKLYIYITYLIAGGHSNLFILQREILIVINSLTTEKNTIFYLFRL